jgi:Domain of unknown function (DUF6894)
MTRYYFHLTIENGDLLKDDEGESFDQLAGAQQNAKLVARELELRANLGGRAITVTDVRGEVVFRTPITGEE